MSRPHRSQNGRLLGDAFWGRRRERGSRPGRRTGGCHRASIYGAAKKKKKNKQTFIRANLWATLPHIQRKVLIRVNMHDDDHASVSDGEKMSHDDTTLRNGRAEGQRRTSFAVPGEVDADVGFAGVDLGKSERRHIAPNLQSFPKDAPHLLLAHLPREAHDPDKNKTNCFFDASFTIL